MGRRSSGAFASRDYSIAFIEAAEVLLGSPLFEMEKTWLVLPRLVRVRTRLSIATSRGGVVPRWLTPIQTEKQYTSQPMKILITVCLLFSFAPRLSAQKNNPPPGINYATYLLIKIGKKYSEVVKTLGKQGVEVSRHQPGLPVKQKLVRYRWDNDRGGRIVVTFHNGRVTAMAQKGLL